MHGKQDTKNNYIKESSHAQKRILARRIESQQRMISLFAVFVCALVALRLWHAMSSRDDHATKILSNGGESGLMHFWHNFIDNYGVPFGHICISIWYSVYTWFTLFNVIIFIVKYVPTGLYMYKFFNNYITSRERINQKQMELEDIQLQIQIVNTKLCVRDAEFTERAEKLHRDLDKLRKLRARVRNIISTDEVLQGALDGSNVLDSENVDVQITPEQDRDFIVELLKGLKHESVPVSERQQEKMQCGEYGQPDANTSENSVYSSLSDTDMKQDCRVKIVKVTNVYKVAYLKHFIKQKRLRRAQKHALLKKRMESIKNLLEEWQKTLNMVTTLNMINNKMALLNMESRLDAASQEAMGDFSKPTLREFSDSDSDLRNSCDDVPHEEYGLSWTQNAYKSCCYNYEDIQEPSLHRELCEPQDYSEVKYTVRIPPCDHNTRSQLCVLPEETSSQLAIEKVKYDGDDYQLQPQAVV